MGNVYQWVKIFHVMFVVAWMAGLLYLPRIFVYHSMDDTTDETSNVFKLMEKRLFYFIMYPSALIVWSLVLVCKLCLSSTTKHTAHEKKLIGADQKRSAQAFWPGASGSAALARLCGLCGRLSLHT